MGGESARPGKRPQRALTTLEKIEAIVRVHEGESKASVARDIGVPESTLRGWCKSEQKLRDTAARGSPESGASSPASTSGPLASSASGLQLSSALAAAAAAAAAANNSEDEAQQVPSTRSRQSSRKRKSELAEDCLAESTCAGIVSSSVDSASATCGGSSITVDSSTTGSSTTGGVTSAKQPKLDYVQSLLTSLAQVNGGLRSAQDNSLLLQQLNLLSKVQSTAALGNLMGLAAVTAAATNQSSHNLIGNNNNSTSASFVENGLQYSKSNNSSRGASRTSSAVAPTSHPDSVGKSTRKSLPPAAEAPISLVPSSPRSNGLSATTMTTSTSTNNGNSSSSGHKYNGSHSSGTGVKKDSNGLTREQRQHEETLRLWLQQQQALLGHANTLNQQMAAASDGSWFWQWYKQCSYPSVTGASLSSSHVSTSSNSPSKVKAVLDNVLSENTINNNNSHTIKRNLNSTNSTTIAEDLSISGTTTTASSTTTTAASVQDEKIPSSEEAIEYGEKFFKWLNRCSDPSVTQMQIMQFKFLLDSLKSCRANKTASLKHSRK